jgi:hypothetical protein
VDRLTEWKTPSTVLGYIVQMNMSGTTLSVNNQYTFVDKNGDGDIEGNDETIKTISISAMANF